VALHLVGRKEDAVVSFRNAISLKPENPQPYAFLAAVYADLGQLDKAKEAADEVLRLNPKFTASRFMQIHTLHNHARDARFKDLLQRAGLPE
jgi:tetratricopeptide (TPR) repeat protein